MLKRAHIVGLLLALLTAGSYGATPDGSTIDKAIPLKQRGLKAVEEQMRWMIKLHGYTPVLAMRDAALDIARQLKAGKRWEIVKSQSAWSHRTLKRGRQWCSYWWFFTPRGRQEIYFDTGVSIDTPGAVEQQESDVRKYIEKKWQSFNSQQASNKSLKPTPLPVALLSFMSYPCVMKPRLCRRGLAPSR